MSDFEAEVARVRARANTALAVWLSVWSVVMIVLSIHN